jgi:transposase
MGEVSTIGVDLAKNVFQVHGADASGAVVFRRKLRRHDVLGFFARQPRCVVVMEACGGAHYWGREIGRLGHEVKLIAPAYVKPFVKLCSPDHNFTNRQVTIMRRNVRRRPDCWRFRSHSSALFQSVSSQASTLASRFQDG